MNKRFLSLLCVAMLITITLSGCNITVSADGSSEPININITDNRVKQTAEPEDVAVIDSNDAFFIAMNPKRDYLTLVNNDHEYEFGGTYDRELQKDLIYLSDVYGEPTGIEKATGLAFTMLQADLRKKGIDIGFYSGYRTKEDQKWVLDHYGANEDWVAQNTIAEPGFSEHHTGLLVNILIWGEENGEETWITETAERQAAHPEFAIVHQTLADYGFIDRYPAEKEEITGVKNEPYEIRFVGNSKIAHEIMDNGLCLEEYLENK